MTSLLRNKSAIILCVLMMLSVTVPRSLCFAPFVVGVIGYAILSFRQKAPLALDRSLAIFFALITSLSIFSFFWATFPDSVLHRSFNTGGLLLCGLLMLAFANRQTFTSQTAAKAVIITYWLTALYFAAEYYFGFPIVGRLVDNFAGYNFNRSMVVLTLLLAPTLFLARKMFPGWKAASAVVVSALLPLSQTGSQTAQMVLLCILAGYGIFWRIKNTGLRRLILNITMIGICLGILTAPLIPPFLLQQINPAQSTSNFATEANIGGRLEIWNFVASKIQEKPWLGHGIEATRNFETEDMLMTYNKGHSVLHPHNGMLQIWVETGIPGALLACAFVIFLIGRIRKAPDFAQPLYYAVLLGSLCLISTGYGLWQSWQLGLLLSLSALCTLVTRIPEPEKA